MRNRGRAGLKCEDWDLARETAGAEEGWCPRISTVEQSQQSHITRCLKPLLCKRFVLQTTPRSSERVVLGTFRCTYGRRLTTMLRRLNLKERRRNKRRVHPTHPRSRQAKHDHDHDHDDTIIACHGHACCIMMRESRVQCMSHPDMACLDAGEEGQLPTASAGFIRSSTPAPRQFDKIPTIVQNHA